LTSSTNIRDIIKNLIPKYKVNVHPDVDAFIQSIPEPAHKKSAQDLLNDLSTYPEVLKQWDVQKVKGRENTFRVRIGRYRIAFVVDKKERQIDVPAATMK
jgi:mRNA interferase RelE/StbE